VFLRYERWLTVESAINDEASTLINNNQVFINAQYADHIDTDWTLHEIEISLAWLSIKPIDFVSNPVNILLFLQGQFKKPIDSDRPFCPNKLLTTV